MRALSDAELKAKLEQAMSLIAECVQAITSSPRILIPVPIAAKAYGLEPKKLHQYCRLGRMRCTWDGKQYLVTAEEMDRVFYPPVQTMILETAAKAYGVKLATLRLYCTRGWVVGQKFNGAYFVTRQEMDRVFRGVVAEKPPAPIPVEVPKWKDGRKGRRSG